MLFLRFFSFEDIPSSIFFFSEITSPILRVFTYLSKAYKSNFVIIIISFGRVNNTIDSFNIFISHKIALIGFEGV